MANSYTTCIHITLIFCSRSLTCVFNPDFTELYVIYVDFTKRSGDRDGRYAPCTDHSLKRH